jgi:RNA polymerase sigma-70 factor, ECF subfamily
MSDTFDRSVQMAEGAPAADGRQRFERLCLPYQADLYRFVFWLCRNRALTEDVLQETLVRAWRSIATLDDDGAVRPWLFTIARRELARTFERKRPETMDLESILQTVGDDGPTAANQSELADMRRALLQLEDQYREPLILQALFGYSTAEIATQLGISVGAVLTRLYRARHALRRRLSGAVDEGEADELS